MDPYKRISQIVERIRVEADGYAAEALLAEEAALAAYEAASRLEHSLSIMGPEEAKNTLAAIEREFPKYAEVGHDGHRVS